MHDSFPTSSAACITPSSWCSGRLVPQLCLYPVVYIFVSGGALGGLHFTTSSDPPHVFLLLLCISLSHLGHKELICPDLKVSPSVSASWWLGP